MSDFLLYEKCKRVVMGLNSPKQIPMARKYFIACRKRMKSKAALMAMIDLSKELILMEYGEKSSMIDFFQLHLCIDDAE